jgi:hypothetical protein
MTREELEKDYVNSYHMIDGCFIYFLILLMAILFIITIS